MKPKKLECYTHRIHVWLYPHLTHLHQNRPNVGKSTIHECCGTGMLATSLSRYEHDEPSSSFASVEPT